MKKNYIYSSVIAIVILLILGISLSKEKNKEPKNFKKTISLSTFILYDVAKHIAEDTIELVRIVPSGVDIHSFEPTPTIMAKVEKSDLLLYSGAGLEPWLTSFHFNARAVGVANYIKLKHLDKGAHNEHEGHTCSHSEFDPHFWLDVQNMKEVANIVCYELITLEPKHKLMYLENRDKYINMLEHLDSKYKEVLNISKCKLNTIITNHDAFSYLSEKYGFEVSSLKGLSPDSEPSPKDMIRIIDEINKYKTSVIFFEDFSSSKSIQSLAEQANVRIDSLHTLGNTTKDDVVKHNTYETIMLQNLVKLSEALTCQ